MSDLMNPNMAIQLSPQRERIRPEIPSGASPEVVAAWESVYQVKIDDLLYTFRKEDDKAICGSKTNNGTPCKQHPKTGRNRCRIHGGATPRGIANANFKHGLYSKDVVGRFGDKYQAMLNDPRLMDMTEDVAIIRARISLLLQELDGVETGEAWRDLGKSYNRLKRALEKQETTNFNLELANIGRVINRGVGEWAKWDELYKAENNLVKISDAQHKRTKHQEDVLTAGQAKAMIRAILFIIRKHVKDDKTLMYIAEEINKVLMDNSVT